MENQTFQPFKDVVLHDECVCTWQKSPSGNIEYSRVADFIDVSKVTENLDTGNMSITLIYSDSTANSETKEITVGLAEIATKAKILDLASKGVDVNESNVKCVIKHIRNRREGVEKSFVHSNIGFFNKNGEYYFKSYKIFGCTKELDLLSDYIGTFLIKTEGDGKKWLELVKRVVVGKYPLELALSIGFSAPVVGFIAGDIGIESPLIHIYGDSTQGKTTAAMLAVSAFGSPNIKEKGLVMTWNTTSNGMHGSIAGNTGVPVVFDESSMANKKDFTKDIYSLTAGKDKIRMNKECEIREEKSWNTTIISTGEHSIFSKSKANTGMRMRLFEFGNISWTESAKQADEIKETILANYGHCGKVFVRKLMRLGKEKILEIHKQCKTRLIDKLDDSDFRDRIAGKLAVIMVAATILKEQMKININIEKIEELIIKNEAENFDDKDISEKAYDILIQVVAKNASKFEKYNENSRFKPIPPSDRESWGIIETKGKRDKEEVRLVVISEIFNKILKEHGFDEPKIVLKKWKEKGMLDYEANKLTRRRKIEGIDKVTCYVINLKKPIKNKAEKNELKTNTK
ncbi:DUF927 domain-containing protein [Clostridium drakei]|uniref:DUF927 domain-containing protein n=1 Tax=Clostridium drakei TaxID=332101 RepID=A0A2U8DLM5_9CLOT|nr:DUF927 domain-containing protein [Clostridium drakei]AWI03112.1 hypothetical protein B9W14_00850 [Clostridium drakei]